MELLNDHIVGRGKRSVCISHFFRKKADIIQNYCNQLEPENKELDLKQFWSGQIDLFAQQNPSLRVTKDSYAIDFTDFAINRIKHIDNFELKMNVSKTRSQAVHNLIKDDVFQSNDMSITNLVVLNKLNSLKHSLRHVPDLHKKDLLCYSIIDLVSSKKQSVHKALTTAQIEKYKQDYKSKFFVSNEASLFTKKIMERAKSTSLKQALKNTKNAINLQPDTPLKAQTHAICKIVKTFAAALENNGNKLNGSYNETEYTFFFLYPVIKHLLYSVPFNFKLGESHLQCAIKKTDDDEAADAGPKIDIIMSHKENGLALSVVEVSGPNYKTNKNHFVSDRNKIAKNLKAILRQIQKTCSTPDIVAFKKIKVYGLQVYKNKLYIYSLSQISFSYYLFILEKTIEIPSSPGLLYQQLPGFLASISYLVNIYEDMNTNIMKFFGDSNTHAMPIYSNSEASTPNVSPKKQKLSRSSAQ